jgi:hypothetical protein
VAAIASGKVSTPDDVETVYKARWVYDYNKKLSQEEIAANQQKINTIVYDTVKESLNHEDEGGIVFISYKGSSKYFIATENHLQALKNIANKCFDKFSDAKLPVKEQQFFGR